jgi:serine/threonine-protein kinase RsbW/stage II sporulation protein AB (anti-sigma F factor)
VPQAEPFDHSWPAVAANVPVARRAVVGHLAEARTPDPPLNDVGLVVSEAVSNVVNHAYRDGDPGSMRVQVEITHDEVLLTVQDDGAGMKPRPDSPGLGLGMPLIATVADRFDVRPRRGGGTSLCIWFSLDPREATFEE